MIPNRSVPKATVVPVLAYADVAEASEWLCRAFGLQVRLRIAEHRVQLTYGDGAVIATDGGGSTGTDARHSVLVRVEDVQSHHDRALANGARIVSPPTDYPYGERQYTADDPGGYRWVFSQSLADVDPGDWGGVLVAGETD